MLKCRRGVRPLQETTVNVQLLARRRTPLHSSRVYQYSPAPVLLACLTLACSPAGSSPTPGTGGSATNGNAGSPSAGGTASAGAASSGGSSAGTAASSAGASSGAGSAAGGSGNVAGSAGSSAGGSAGSGGAASTDYCSARAGLSLCETFETHTAGAAQAKAPWTPAINGDGLVTIDEQVAHSGKQSLKIHGSGFTTFLVLNGAPFPPTSGPLHVRMYVR